LASAVSTLRNYPDACRILFREFKLSIAMASIRTWITTERRENTGGSPLTQFSSPMVDMLTIDAVKL
jgi:hypothetical protein